MSGYIKALVCDKGNERLYYFETDKDLVVFDPGYGAERLMRDKLKTGKKISVFLTHAHHDHFADIEYFLQSPDSVGYCGKDDIELLVNSELNCAALHNIKMEFPHLLDKIVPLNGGEKFTFGDHTFRTYLIQGHTNGGIFFIDDDAKIVISGDSIQKGHIGMTVVPTANVELLKKNNNEFLSTLTRDYVLLPGHTEPTTVGEELDTNEWLK